MNIEFDVAVVGGGLVGLATACALSKYNLNIAVIDENFQYNSFPSKLDEIGLRASAINGASQHYFEEIGIWQELCSSRRVQFFTKIDVWEKNGKAHLSANSGDYGYANLGCIIENNIMQHHLYQSALSSSNITLFSCSANHCSFEDEYAFLTLTDNVSFKTKLVIGADGAHSWLRSQQNIPIFEHDYLHHAVITTVETEYPHQNCAKQVFYPDGIVAFLPLWQANKSCLVWSTKPDHAVQLSSMPNSQFSSELFALTGDRVGVANLINSRKVFPLKARFAKRFVKHRLVIIGDAAHTIHPLAGQGVNLGFQDSSSLVSIIGELIKSGKDIGLSPYLKSFQCERRKDTLVMLTAMQVIQDMFNSDNLVKKELRATGMNMIERCLPLKKQLIKYAMHI